MKTILFIKEVFGELLAFILILLIFGGFYFSHPSLTMEQTLKDVLLAVVFYFFGSSAGSKRKTEKMEAEKPEK